MNTELLHISALSDQEGWGVAYKTHVDGKPKAVAVPYTLVGEEVQASCYRYKAKSGARLLGVVQQIVRPSPIRIAPRCPHFTSCGGCTFQHMPYEQQLKFKEEKIRKLFAGSQFGSEAKFKTIIGCAQPWGYRNKMEFTFSQAKSGQKFLGLILTASKGRVFDVQECHLVDPWMTEALAACRRWWQESTLDAYRCTNNSGSLRTVTLRHAKSSGDRVVMLTVSANPDYALKQRDLDAFVKAITEVATPPTGSFLTIVLRLQQVAKGRQTQFYEMRLAGPDTFREYIRMPDRDLEFQISPSSFFQPNSEQASVLYQEALNLAGLTKEQVLYDLYAGIGVFGMCAAHLVKQVISVELSADSSYDATCNMTRLKIDNMEIYRADVADLLVRQDLAKPDVVIVDPPRSGLGKKAVSQIQALHPHTIVYVSCNAATQAQDVQELLPAGYRIEVIQPVDQFPQTIHCENIVVLKRL